MPDRTFVSLFSGAGGLDLGVARAGFRCTYAVDSDGGACRTYVAAHKRPIRLGYVEPDDPQMPRTADLLVGGPPCQPFSVAGLRVGGDDARNGLPAYLAVLERLRPRAFILENVPGLATPRHRVTLAAALARAGALGYVTSYEVLDAADFGVPQHRKRLFAVGFLGCEQVARDPLAWPGQFQWPTPSHGPTAAPWVSVLEALDGLEPGEPCRARVVYARNPVLRPSPFDGMLVNGAGRPIDLTRPSRTIVASEGGNRTPFLDPLGELVAYHRELMAARADGRPPPIRSGEVAGAMRLTARQVARLQGFPDDYPFVGRPSFVYRQIGNAVPPPLAEAVARAVRAHLDRLEGTP